MEKTSFAVQESAPSRRQVWLGIVLAILALLPLFLWPEEVSWCIDEPRLVANAWHANNDGHLAVHGLYGNFGICYGPVPTQTYQLLLSITHDPVKFLMLRAALIGGLTAAGLLWLGYSLRLPMWFAACVLIAPQITNHHRVLWDASFTIPLGTLALAAFANFLRTRRPWPLRIALVTALELPLIHPQSLPLAVPILGYLLWQHRSDLWKDRRGILWTLAVLVALNAKYLIIAPLNVLYRIFYGSAASYPGQGSRWISAVAPFFGGHLLNGYDYVYKMARPAGPDWLVTTLAWCGRLIYAFIWVGIATAFWRLPQAIRVWRGKVAEVPAGVLVAGVAAIGLIVQMLIFTGLRIPLGPQYYFGTFALHAYLAWLGVDTLRKVRIGTIAGAAFGISCAYITLGSAYVLRHHGYDYVGWPTMRSAMELTRALNAYEDTVAFTDIEFLQKHPQPLRTVRLLMPPAPGTPQKRSGNLLITYARKEDGTRTGRMIVQDLGSAAPPKEAVPMQITPLPRDWVPDPSTW